jgi:hypothetical protein
MGHEGSWRTHAAQSDVHDCGHDAQTCNKSEVLDSDAYEDSAETAWPHEPNQSDQCRPNKHSYNRRADGLRDRNDRYAFQHVADAESGRNSDCGRVQPEHLSLVGTYPANACVSAAGAHGRTGRRRLQTRVSRRFQR